MKPGVIPFLGSSLLNNRSRKSSHHLGGMHLKILIFVQYRGGGKLEPGGICFLYSEDFKFAPNKDNGQKDVFEMYSTG